MATRWGSLAACGCGLQKKGKKKGRSGKRSAGDSDEDEEGKAAEVEAPSSQDVDEAALVVDDASLEVDFELQPLLEPDETVDAIHDCLRVKVCTTPRLVRR